MGGPSGPPMCLRGKSRSTLGGGRQAGDGVVEQLLRIVQIVHLETGIVGHEAVIMPGGFSRLGRTV